MIEILKGKIIRPKTSTTLGMYVYNQEHAFLDKYALKVRYFALNPKLGWGDKDVLTITENQLLDQFEALVNSDHIKSFEDAKWVPLSEIQDYIDSEEQ